MSSYTEIRNKIDSSVFLLPVSKTKSYDAIMSVYSEGARVFGENRVQEAERKFPAPGERPEGMKVYLIGQLQRNKVKKAVSLFDRIESVDSIALLEAIDMRSAELNKTMDVLLEYNSSGEDAKSGFRNEEDLVSALSRSLEILCSEISSLTVLSMGMSADYEIAISEGSTEVRIGSAIFGERK